MTYNGLEQRLNRDEIAFEIRLIRRSAEDED